MREKRSLPSGNGFENWAGTERFGGEIPRRGGAGQGKVEEWRRTKAIYRFPQYGNTEEWVSLEMTPGNQQTARESQTTGTG